MGVFSKGISFKYIAAVNNALKDIHSLTGAKKGGRRRLAQDRMQAEKNYRYNEDGATIRAISKKIVSDQMSRDVEILVGKVLDQCRSGTDSSLIKAWSAYFPWLKGMVLCEFLKCSKKIVQTLNCLVSSLRNRAVPLDGFLSAEEATTSLLALVLVMKSVDFVRKDTKHLLDALFPCVDHALMCLPATKQPVIAACLFSSSIELRASESVDSHLELETDEDIFSTASLRASSRPSMYVILVRTARDVSWLCGRNVLLLRRQATLQFVDELPYQLTGTRVAMLHESSRVAPERSDLLDLYSRLQWAVVSTLDDTNYKVNCRIVQSPSSSVISGSNDVCGIRFIADVFKPHFGDANAPAFHLLVVGDERSCYRAMLCCLTYTLRMMKDWVPRYVSGFTKDALGMGDEQTQKRVVWLIDAIRPQLECMPPQNALTGAAGSYVVFATTEWAASHARPAPDTFCVCEVTAVDEDEPASPLSPTLQPGDAHAPCTPASPASRSPKITHCEKNSSLSSGILPVRPASAVPHAGVQQELQLAGASLYPLRFSGEHLWVNKYKMRFLAQLPKRLVDELARCAADLQQRLESIANTAESAFFASALMNPTDGVDDACRAILTILLYVSPLGPLIDKYFCRADAPKWASDFATCLNDAVCRLPPISEQSVTFGCIHPYAIVAGRHPFVRFKTFMPLLGDKGGALERFVEQHREDQSVVFAVVRAHSLRDVSWASSALHPCTHWLMLRETVLHVASALPEVVTSTCFHAEASVWLMFEVFSVPHSLGASQSSSADAELAENMVELSRASFGLLRTPCMDLAVRTVKPLEKGSAAQGRFFEHLIPALLKDENPRMVLLIGESGSGKSTLLLEAFNRVLDRLDLKALGKKQWFPIFHDLVEERGGVLSASLVDDVRWLSEKFRVVVFLHSVSSRMAEGLMDFTSALCGARATVIVAVRPLWIGTHRSSIPATCIRAELQPPTEEDVQSFLGELEARSAEGAERIFASDLHHAAKHITSPASLRYAILARSEIAPLVEAVTEYEIIRLGIEKQILISARHVTKRDSEAQALAEEVYKTLLEVFFNYYTCAQGQFTWPTKISPRKRVCLWKFAVLDDVALNLKAPCAMQARDEISCACCAALYIEAQPASQRMQSYRACNSPTALRHVMNWHSALPWTSASSGELIQIAALASEVGSDAMFDRVEKLLPPVERFPPQERWAQLMLEGTHYRRKKDESKALEAFRAALELASNLNGGDKSRSAAAEYEIATTRSTLEKLLNALVAHCSDGFGDSMRAAQLRVLIAELSTVENATPAATEQAAAQHTVRKHLDESIKVFQKNVNECTADVTKAVKWLSRAMIRLAELNLRSGKGALELAAHAIELKETFQLEEDSCMYDSLRVQAQLPKKDGDPREVTCALKRSILNMSCWVFPPGDDKIQKAYAELKEDEEQNVRDCKQLLEMVQKDGLKLSCAATKLQGERDLVLAAVRQNGLALQYASAALKRNSRVVFAAAWQNKEASCHAPNTLRVPWDPSALLCPGSHDDFITELFYASGCFVKDAYKLDNRNINPMRPLSGFTLDRVEKAGNDNLQVLTNAYKNLHPRSRSVLDAEVTYVNDEQKAVLGMLHQLTDHQNSPQRNLLVVYHGCSAKAAKRICNKGLQSGALKRDPGYFGSGIYTTPNAEYACKYSAKPGMNLNDSYPVVMCIAVVDKVYPVTRRPINGSGRHPPAFCTVRQNA